MTFFDARTCTPEDAADPATSPKILADMARLRPDLRPVIWGNPACPEVLRGWMREAQAAEAAGLAAPVPPSLRELVPPAQQPPTPVPTMPQPSASVEVAGTPDPADAAVMPSPPRGTGTTSPASHGSDSSSDLAADPAGPAPRPPRRGRRRRVGFALLAALVLGAAGGGFVAGWTLSGEIEARKPAVESTVVEVEVPSYAGTTSVPMPDVRGLDETAAREVLADAGISLDIVEMSSREAAGPEGVVVEQSPAFGTTDPEDVALVVSTQALVPEVDGLDSARLIASLGVLGADVEIVTAYVPGAASGTALSITPTTGEPLPSHVTLTVAEASSSIFLTALDRVDGQCSSTSGQINGVTYPDTVSCAADAEGKETSWVLSRVVDSLEATVGVPDAGDPATRVRVEVFADGVLVGSAEAGYGAPAPLVAPVTGALRVTVRTTLLSGDPDGWASEVVLLGDARAVGGAQAITALDP